MLSLSVTLDPRNLSFFSVVGMAKCFVLEISVQTTEAARAAERGGANRIELCAELSVGGLTPSRALLFEAREAVGIPIFSMIRPRAGDFVYSDEEFQEMKCQIAVAKASGMNGVVLGLLHEDRRVDVARTRELIELARPLPVTFHRAFDECLDVQRALETVMQSGATRILTSGGAKSALHGAGTLRALVQAAGDRVIILPGGGISAANVGEVVRRTGAHEFHSGLSAAIPYARGDYPRLALEVQNLSAVLAGMG